MDFQTPGAWDSLRSGIRELCSEFGDTYWQELDHDRAYPLEFVQALGQAGWLSTLIPTKYNGGGVGLEAQPVNALAASFTSSSVYAPSPDSFIPIENNSSNSLP